MNERQQIANAIAEAQKHPALVTVLFRNGQDVLFIGFPKDKAVNEAYDALRSQYPNLELSGTTYPRIGYVLDGEMHWDNPADAEQQKAEAVSA